MTDDEQQNNVVHLDFKKGEAAQLSGAAGAEKRAAFTELIARGKTMVTLDARRPGVRVPRQFKDELQLNLDFSSNFVGVNDFEWDETGVRSTLTFQRQPFFCDVPWSAVWAMRSHVDNQMLLWPEDLPEEMLAQIPEAQLILKAKQEDRAQKEEEQARERMPREVPRVDAPDEEPPPDDPGKRRPGLRLVKD